jgi:DNA-binding SARP family transcriptional activator
MDVRVLGPLEIAADDGGVLPLGGPKQRAVVAHLVLRAGHAVPAEQLIDELWGEEPPETARNTLQTYVYRLRKVLGEERLESRGGAYVLHAEPDEIDAARFEELVRAGRARLAEDPAGALERLDEALGLWRGPAFADFPDEPSLRGEIARLEELRLAATEHRVAAQLALGRHTTVVGTLESLTDRYPLRERLWASLMLALYRSGRQAEALDAYRRAREVLADELGIDPSPELQALQERILRQDPDLAAAAPPALDATPMTPATPAAGGAGASGQTGPRSVPGDLGPGTVFAGYRIDSVLGRGGMSVVYLAEHLGLERKVALKVLAPQLAEDERFHDRFVRESRIAASMEHPSIVPIYEAGEAEGLLFLAMRYVRGTDLHGLIRREGSLDPERTAWIVSEVASALDAAHARGLVHRDVKPGNILIVEGEGRDGRDQVYLSDFGLTKRLEGGTGGLTQTGQFVGTVEFVAPEQIEGRTVDGRADIYSLACVAFECLSGRPPFARDAQVATLYAHLRERPPSVTVARPELPPATDRVLAKGLAKAASDRYPTCRAFAEALSTALGPLAGEAAPAGEGGGSPRWWRTAAVAAAAAVVAGIVVFMVADGPSPPAEGSTPGGSPSASAAPSPSPPPQRFATVDRPLTADEERLEGYLPPTVGTCLPLDREESTRGELASLVCRDDDVEVLFQLFPRLDLMDAAFQTGANIAGAPDGDCATDHEAVDEYRIAGERAGRVLCFVRGPGPGEPFGGSAVDSSHITWTDERLLVFADALRRDASDLSLFQWWVAAGPVVPDSGVAGTRKQAQAQAPEPLPDGTYLANPEPDRPGYDPVTESIDLDGGAYRYGLQAQVTETGTLSFRKPNTIVFTPLTGFCFNPEEQERGGAEPAAYSWTWTRGTLSWHFREGGRCAGPGVPSGARRWILAPPGLLVVESSNLVATLGPGGYDLTEFADIGTNPNITPDWSSDGRRIVYAGAAEDLDLFVMDADGAGAHPLVREPGDQLMPSWSVDDRIAYTFDDLGDPERIAGIAVVNADGSGREVLYEVRNETVIAPSWSPDGSRLAFAVSHGTNAPSTPYGVYVMDADGSDLREIFEGTGYAPPPAWTPDGRRLVVWADGDRGETLYSMRPDGSGVEPFLDRPPRYPTRAFDAPAKIPVTILGIGWSPNGRWAVVSTPDGGGIWLLRGDGTGELYFVAWQMGTEWRPRPTGASPD